MARRRLKTFDNLRLTGLLNHKGNGADHDHLSRWNFILSNGQESECKTEKFMAIHTLPDKPIRKVQMAVYGDNRLIWSPIVFTQFPDL